MPTDEQLAGGGSREYVDVRELSPEYTTIPCTECGREFYVNNRFAFNHDSWYCNSCKPEELKEATESLRDPVEVRI